MLSKRIQVVLSDRIASQVETAIKEDGYENISDFFRSLAQEYLIKKQFGLLEAPRLGSQ